MNRREFARRALAAASVPLLPALPAASAAASTAAPTVAINPFTYAWSAHYASVSRSVSAEALARRFALSPDAAGAIFQRLQTAGIVSAPNALGMAEVSRSFARPKVVAKPLTSLKQAARKGMDALEALDPEEEDAAEDAASFTKG